jgi:CP family cyanate transporter-like MFS transporter
VSDRARRSPFREWPFLVAVASVGLMLRGPVVAVAPIAGTISLDLGLSAAQIGLLTGLPVLCFALLTPFASFLASRTGPRAAVVIAIAGTGLGTIVRSAGGVQAVFVGTILMGAFITVGNVVLPVVIRQRTTSRVGVATGTYAAALNMGSMLTSLATAPLASAFGWQTALLFWLVFVLLAGVAWLLVVRKPAAPPAHRISERPDAAVPPPRSVRVASFLLAIAFAGQSFAYFSITAWLPTLLAEEVGFGPAAAGAGASVFQLVGVAGANPAPALLALIGRGKTIVVIAALWFVFLVGMIVAPHAWLVWTVVGGLAQSTGISAILTLIVTTSLDERTSRRASALVQGLGYGLGSFGPTLVGGLRDATGGWSVPLMAVMASIVVFGVFGVFATVRARHDQEIPPLGRI